MLWRGAVEWPSFMDGKSYINSGGTDCKFVLYPISAGKTPETQLMNWPQSSARPNRAAHRLHARNGTGKRDWLTFRNSSKPSLFPSSISRRWLQQPRFSGNSRCATVIPCKSGVSGGQRYWEMPPIRCILLAPMGRHNPFSTVKNSLMNLQKAALSQTR